MRSASLRCSSLRFPMLSSPSRRRSWPIDRTWTATSPPAPPTVRPLTEQRTAAARPEPPLLERQRVGPRRMPEPAPSPPPPDGAASSRQPHHSHLVTHTAARETSWAPTPRWPLCFHMWLARHPLDRCCQTGCLTPSMHAAPCLSADRGPHRAPVDTPPPACPVADGSNRPPPAPPRGTTGSGHGSLPPISAFCPRFRSSRCSMSHPLTAG